MEIHPYVQGRLRAMPRQEGAGGILLGASENGVTRITGFKRVPPAALRQAADDAGPALAGFFRLQTPEAPGLQPWELELCRQTKPLFLLLHAVNGTAGTAVVCRPGEGQAGVETLPLAEARKAPPAPVPPVRAAAARLPWLALGLAVAVSAAGAAYYAQAGRAAAPELALDVQSTGGELAATWRQTGGGAHRLQWASLTIQDGVREEAVDLTSTFTPEGRVVLHPRANTIAVTLQVRYEDGPRLSRSTTYVGFTPAAAPPVVREDPGLRSELATLRKRNKELLDAVTALRKHFEQ